ncbi:MAG: ATP-dependent sacrificial sulfur transferase LarE [Planctomycetes bacterium]|nr:ATP-dependent sacrificial sulfur transferase LarE [Planctomycetota bacterium]
MEKELQQKYQKLQDIIRRMPSAVVAYSGGVDSTFLAFACNAILKNKSIAVTAVSETYPQKEYEEAVAFARQMGLNHRIIHTSELSSEEFSRNPVNRCYYCKQELFKKLREIADKEDVPDVLDGTTLSDEGDYRPGRQAACELKVRSPLAEAGLNKKEVRELSQLLNVPSWDKPAYACLASRFPYGEEITVDKLKRVEEAEELLHKLGFRVCRVRSHQNMARIEVEVSQLTNLISQREPIVTKLQDLGFDYVTLDLEGYRSGSMNKNISTLSTEEAVQEAQTPGAEMDLAVAYFTCPHCQDQKLYETVTKNTRYRQCEKCGGIWFNINEMEKAVGDKIRFNLPQSATPQETMTTAKCPACFTNMSVIRGLELPDVKISACMICQGRWINGSEVAKLQARGIFNQVKSFIMRLF